KDDPARPVLAPQRVAMFQELLRQPAVQADADGDVLGVHELDEFVEELWVFSQPESWMDVDIDDREFRPSQMMFLDAQHGLRMEATQGQVASVASVEQ